MSDRSQEGEGMRFDILKAVAGDGAAARLGRLALPKRQAVETPNFFTMTSRGVVPHLTPDTIARYCPFPGAYLAMEDLVEKSQKTVTKIPAVAKIPAQDGKRLHAFTALPSSSITVLGPRRVPAVRASTGNSDTSVQIFTSNGFQPLTNPSYIASIATLKPDIAIPLADMHYAAAVPSPQAKGLRRMCERTEDWMEELHRSLDLAGLRASNTSIFAPTLPAPHSVQWEYLGRLSGDLLDKFSGLAVHDVDILPDLSSYPPLLPLPRLSLDAPSDPHEILRQVSLGIDTFLIPFLNTVSDAGVAMTFAFPPPSSPPAPQDPTATADEGTDLLPLGIDLTEPHHATALAPLVPGCTCHACTAHHRAYLHHLLSAREMLVWTLLQLHNHHVLARFFAGVRASLAAGPERFEEDRRAFGRAYAPGLPAGMGTRPRARGYHFKSGPSDERRNKVTWQLLQEGQTRQGREKQQLAAGDETETPVVPGEEVDAMELVRQGLGEVDIKRGSG